MPLDSLETCVSGLLTLAWCFDVVRFGNELEAEEVHDLTALCVLLVLLESFGLGSLATSKVADCQSVTRLPQLGLGKRALRRRWGLRDCRSAVEVLKWEATTEWESLIEDANKKCSKTGAASTTCKQVTEHGAIAIEVPGFESEKDYTHLRNE